MANPKLSASRSFARAKPLLPRTPKPGNTPPVFWSTILQVTSLTTFGRAKDSALRVGPSAARQNPAPSHRARRLGRTPLVAVAVCLSATLGCNSFRGLAQCRSVTATINGVLEQAREIHEQEPTAERYKELTKLLQGLETTLTGLTVADNDLKQAVDDYVKQLHRSSKEADVYGNMLDQLAKAKTNNDAAATASAEGELAKVRQRASRALEGVKPLAKRFRDACRK